MVFMDTFEKLVDAAAGAVKKSMEERPVKDSDGIWRFDLILRTVLGHMSYRSKEDWHKIQEIAWKKNFKKETWDREGYGIVASFAQTNAAYATPGFAEARRNFMT